MGEWLRKLPKSDVPLVAAADPVARRAGKWRSKAVPPVRENIAPAETAPHAVPEDADFIRPRRMPTPENGPRNVSISRNATPAAVSTERSDQGASSSPVLASSSSAKPSVGTSVPVSVSSSAAAISSQSASARVAPVVVSPLAPPHRGSSLRHPDCSAARFVRCRGEWNGDRRRGQAPVEVGGAGCCHRKPGRCSSLADQHGAGGNVCRAE